MLCALLAFSELVAVVDDELFSDEPVILVFEVVFCWPLITG